MCLSGAGPHFSLRSPGVKGGGVSSSPPFLSGKKGHDMSHMREKPFTARFIDAEEKVLLELTNTTDEVLKGVEILAVFLKDQGTPGGGPSRSHIKFDPVKAVKPKEKAVLSHRTWIDGKPADAD